MPPKANRCAPRRATSATVKPWRTIQDPLRSRLRNPELEYTNEAPERHGALQLFTLWTASTASAQAIIDDGVTPTRSIHLVRGRQEEADCWWIVDLCGREVIRTSDPLGLEPLLRTRIEQAGLRTTRLRGRVTWLRAGVGCEMDFDIGTGTRFAIEGDAVNVYILVPQALSRAFTVRANTLPGQPTTAPVNPASPNASVPIPEPRPPILPSALGGRVLDTLVQGHVLHCVSTNADRTAKLTQTFERPAGDADFAVPIPPRAKHLKVSMPAPGLLTPLQFRMGPLAADPIVQQLFFDLFINVRSTPTIPIPENATHVTLGAADPDNARRWTFVWLLEF